MVYYQVHCLRYTNGMATSTEGSNVCGKDLRAGSREMRSPTPFFGKFGGPGFTYYVKKTRTHTRRPRDLLTLPGTPLAASLIAARLLSSARNSQRRVVFLVTWMPLTRRGGVVFTARRSPAIGGGGGDAGGGGGGGGCRRGQRDFYITV